MTNLARNAAKLIALALMVLAYSGAAQAGPIVASIDISGSYSLLHPVNENGFGEADDWLWFNEGQTLNLDLDLGNNLLTLNGTQSFTLTSNNGVMANMDIVGLSMDLNDSDGFLSGALNYLLNGTAGTFSFGNQNYNNAPFNSSSMNDGLFSLFVWGADDVNAMGIDLGISAVVPEPATWTLLLVGVAGVWLGRRRQT